MDSLENSIQTETDFQTFSPAAYLEQNYSRIEQEDVGHLKCLANAYNQVRGNDLELLEFGGGPTLYQLISAAPKVSKIYFADYLDLNLKEVRKWKDREPGAFDWHKVTTEALKAEGIEEPTVDQINDRENDLRAKLTEFLLCDAFDASGCPLKQVERLPRQYDVVNTHFVFESITNNWELCKKAFASICSCVKPGGRLIGASMKASNWWINGTRKFPATPIEEKDIRHLLAENQFSEPFTIEKFPAEQEYYNEVIFFSAVRKLV